MNHETHKSSAPAAAFYSDIELARFLGLSVAAVRRWRLEGRGPGWVKLSKSVRYAIADVEAWLSSRPRGGGGAGR